MLKQQYKILFTFLLFSSCFCNAQTNLVPNPSFEIHDTCPDQDSQLSYAVPWFQPSTGTPDYYNACADTVTYINLVNVPVTGFGRSYAHTGIAMAGEDFYDDVAINWIYREYMAVKLTATLVNSQKYYVTYFVKLADSSRYATDAISVFFKNDSIHKSTYDTIWATPQINNTPGGFITSKTSWTKLRGSFIANGTEKYMYIGNFKPTCTNDTVFIAGGGPQSDYNYPYYYFDDICVSTDSLYSENWTGIATLNSKQHSQLNIYPNPAFNILNINAAEDIQQIQLINDIGQVLYEADIKDTTSYSLSITNYPNGIYIIRIRTKNSFSSSTINIVH
jgi:type IX secretion system substrate protein